MRFDGKKFAAEIERKLVGSTGRLVILLTADNESGKIYSKKKQELGERIGVKVDVIETEVGEIAELLRGYGADESVDGLMVQLPIGLSKEETQKILDLIPVGKDVDGLTSENLKMIATGEQWFLPATVKAVGKIVDEAIRETGLDIERMKVAVVGSEGVVGRPLVWQLKRFGFEVGEFDLGSDFSQLKSFDVIISAVGKEGLIKPEMVKDGVVAIDVGFPKGDFSPDVEEKAAFFTPVPGGVGPVTVVCLFENLVPKL